MTYIVNIQAGVEILKFEINAVTKRIAEIYAKQSAYSLTKSNYIKLVKIQEVKAYSRTDEELLNDETMKELTGETDAEYARNIKA